MASKYEIVVRGEGSGSAEGYENSLPTSVVEKKIQQGGTDTSGTDVFKAFAKKGAATALVVSTFKWQASLVGRNTGNSDLQQKIDAGMQIAGQGLGIAAGFAVGGVVGGMIAIAAVGISYAQQVEASSYARKWEDISLGQARYRAGANLNRSRI